jgi:predicted O-methyltransferase YrrM
MLRDGLPARLERPLRVLFRGDAPRGADEAAIRIERLRGELAARPDSFEYAVSETPLGLMRLAARAPTSGPLVIRRLAMNVSVPRRLGMFLHLCAEAFDARVILETGTCLGISGAYLVSVPSRPRLVTLEGSEAFATIAKETLATVSDNAVIVIGPFERTLQPTLDRLGEENVKINVAYIDGHHEEAATLHYVRAIVPHLAAEALVVLDDIHLYRGMWNAWRKLASSPGVAAAVNVGRFGLLVYGNSPARDFDLSRYTGWWRIGGSRRDTIAREEHGRTTKRAHRNR